MISEAGMMVLREIPKGLLGSGNTAYGGVVRDAAGKIVAHLAMPTASVAAVAPGGPIAMASAAVAAASGLVSNAQLVSLSKDVHQVLEVAMAGTALAGLGLATSIVGFVYLSRRIDQIDDKLNALNVAVKKVQQILESTQQSSLLSAIDTYKLAGETDDVGKQQALLMTARGSFSKLTHHYKLQLKNLDELAEIEVAEGYFVVACLGNAVCTSDLGMWEASAKDLRRHYVDWQSLARLHCANLLDLESPTRLLEGKYVDDLPAAELIDVLEFANAEERGVAWLDELRRPLGEFKLPDFGSIEKPNIQFAKALSARNKVLNSFAAHFDFLAAKKVPATAFSRALEERTKEDCVVINWLDRPVAA